MAYKVNIKTGIGWKLLLFNAMGNGCDIPYTFKTFSSKFNGELEGLRVDILFKFCQSWGNSMYDDFVLDVIDMEKSTSPYTE